MKYFVDMLGFDEGRYVYLNLQEVFPQLNASTKIQTIDQPSVMIPELVPAHVGSVYKTRPRQFFTELKQTWTLDPTTMTIQERLGYQDQIWMSVPNLIRGLYWRWRGDKRALEGYIEPVQPYVNYRYRQIELKGYAYMFPGYRFPHHIRCGYDAVTDTLYISQLGRGS